MSEDTALDERERKMERARSSLNGLNFSVARSYPEVLPELKSEFLWERMEARGAAPVSIACPFHCSPHFPVESQPLSLGAFTSVGSSSGW